MHFPFRTSGPRRMALAHTLMAVLLATAATTAPAQDKPPLKIGFLSDMTGMIADNSGPGSLAAAKLAVEDAKGTVLGRRIELLSGDHLNKADVGLNIARQWYDEGVRAIFDIGNTSIALGVQDLAREKNRIVVFNSSASSDLTGKYCSPNGMHWAYNSYAQSLGAVKGLLAGGAKTWYFITIDYTYGKNVQRDTTELIERAGGRVVGSTTHAFSSTDFASQLLQAQASKADVIALATTGAHAAAILKQADEFGIRNKGQRVAALGLTLHDVKAMGLRASQDILLPEAFYWDQNDATRAFSRRYRERTGKMPNMIQASLYSAVAHYLKAVAAAGTDDTAAVLARMKATPINDFMTQNGRIREDGRVLRDFYVFRVKKPSESQGEWDLYAPVSTIAADEAFPVDKACPLVR